jgi:hypothetical protein
VRELVTNYLRRDDPDRPEFDSTREHLTFQQYLQLVVNHFNDGFRNAHWASFEEHCQPCHIRYDDVFRLETLSRDIGALYAHVRDLNRTVSVPTIIHANNQAGNIDKLTALRKTYRDTTPDIIQEILRIYQRDFAMFGYQWKTENVSTCSYAEEACC